MNRIADYIALTKPRIVLVFMLTGMAALAVEGSLARDPLWLTLLFLAIGATAGSANGFNQYVERELDAVMRRTREKRPLPAGRLRPRNAWIFSLALGIFACGLLAWRFTLLSAALAAATILFYVLFYTMWLKPRTPYNIVIGGAAGATAPLIAWAAATGTIGWPAWLLFAVIFFWTPPHFWSLALCCMDDYRRAGFPMLPVARGEARTRGAILRYTILVAPMPLLLALNPAVGWSYLLGAALLGAGFCWFAVRVYRERTTTAARALFGYSILYLLLLSVLLTVDAGM
ncbi:MAG: protoheme IX farnesyltransferase [Deltaproteobacteria bacterium]|nr:protoheme IX farnesyltransferase [Deltaproteobacteria bacterium]